MDGDPNPTVRQQQRCMETRGVAQPGRALRSGRRGRKFESCHPDFFGPRAKKIESRWGKVESRKTRSENWMFARQTPVQALQSTFSHLLGLLSTHYSLLPE